MGFLNELFSGVDDVARTDAAAYDDLHRFDFHGWEDRQIEDNTRTVMENDALRTVGLPIADYFSFGLVSPAVKAKYNKMNTGHSGFNLGDFAKAWAANYVANQILPVSETSTLGDVAYNTAAGAGRGAISSGLQGESMTEGAKGGATSGGIMSSADYVGDFFSPETSYVPTDPNRARYNELRQQSTVPGESSYSFTDPTASSKMPAYVPPGSPLAYNYTPSFMSELSSGFSNFLDSIMPATPTRFGDVAQGLMGMYAGHRRNKAGRELRNMMNTNRGSYEANLRDQLARRDAATGRRSNFEGRATELQAALAQLDSRNMPAMMQANEMRYGGMEDMFRSGLSMGRNLGYFGTPRPDPNLSQPIAPVMPMTTLNYPIRDTSVELGNVAPEYSLGNMGRRRQVSPGMYQFGG